MRSVIVSEPSLAAVARNINLGKYILLGKGDLSGAVIEIPYWLIL